MAPPPPFSRPLRPLGPLPASHSKAFFYPPFPLPNSQFPLSSKRNPFVAEISSRARESERGVVLLVLGFAELVSSLSAAVFLPTYEKGLPPRHSLQTLRSVETEKCELFLLFFSFGSIIRLGFLFWLLLCDAVVVPWRRVQLDGANWWSYEVFLLPNGAVGWRYGGRSAALYRWI